MMMDASTSENRFLRQVPTLNCALRLYWLWPTKRSMAMLTVACFTFCYAAWSSQLNPDAIIGKGRFFLKDLYGLMPMMALLWCGGPGYTELIGIPGRGLLLLPLQRRDRLGAIWIAVFVIRPMAIITVASACLWVLPLPFALKLWATAGLLVLAPIFSAISTLPLVIQYFLNAIVSLVSLRLNLRQFGFILLTVTCLAALYQLRDSQIFTLVLSGLALLTIYIMWINLAAVQRPIDAVGSFKNSNEKLEFEGRRRTIYQYLSKGTSAFFVLLLVLVALYAVISATVSEPPRYHDIVVYLVMIGGGLSTIPIRAYRTLPLSTTRLTCFIVVEILFGIAPILLAAFLFMPEGATVAERIIFSFSALAVGLFLNLTTFALNAPAWWNGIAMGSANFFVNILKRCNSYELATIALAAGAFCVVASSLVLILIPHDVLWNPNRYSRAAQQAQEQKRAGDRHHEYFFFLGFLCLVAIIGALMGLS